jgi:predicted dehydrogenase
MNNQEPVGVGILGCGNISKAYFERIKKFPNLRLAACADLDFERALEAARVHGTVARSIDDLLSSEDIEIIVNLTIPAVHAEVDCRVLAAGKHVFSEKPFALDVAEGRKILEAAQNAGKRVGCAPDTVLGAAVQTCRKLMDEGVIGRPVGFSAVMMCRGHEHWHPSPEFYYQRGGGPMFDMGPYYLHALITLLGPVRRVSGMVKTTHAERTILSQPKHGQKVPVEVPTHVMSLLEFANGTMGTLVTSFDVPGPFTNPVIEIFGTEGTLRVPDPNGTSGKVELGAVGGEWQPVPHSHLYADGSRALGVADLAAAIESGRDHRANERIAMHALEIMEAIHVSSAEGRAVELTTTCERPAPMRADLPEFVLDR